MQIYISQPPPPPPKKKKKQTNKKTKKKKKKKHQNEKTKHYKTKTYLEFHYYPYDTERILVSMYMSPYRLLILLRAIGDFIRILIFYSIQES